MRSSRKFGAIFCASVLVLGSSLAGCGGGGGNGGGGGAPSAAQSRSASAVTVQSARTAVASLIAARRFGGGGRKVNLSKIAQATRQEGVITYDEDYGLYYTSEFTETSLRINYFEDEAASVGAGFINLTPLNEEGTSFRINYDISSGFEPQKGDLTFTAEDAEGTTSRIQGNINDLDTGGQLTFDLRLNADESTTGSMASTDEGVTVRFTNLNISPDGALTSNIEFGGLTGTIQQAADESGTLRLNAADGTYVAVYDADGGGTLTEPNGTVTNISDFDTYDAE